MLVPTAIHSMFLHEYACTHAQDHRSDNHKNDKEDAHCDQGNTNRPTAGELGGGFLCMG